MTPERYKELTELNEAEQFLALECIRAGRPIIQTRTITWDELVELRAKAPDHWIARATVNWKIGRTVSRIIPKEFDMKEPA